MLRMKVERKWEGVHSYRVRTGACSVVVWIRSRREQQPRHGVILGFHHKVQCSRACTVYMIYIRVSRQQHCHHLQVALVVVVYAW